MGDFAFRVAAHQHAVGRGVGIKGRWDGQADDFRQVGPARQSAEQLAQGKMKAEDFCNSADEGRQGHQADQAAYLGQARQDFLRACFRSLRAPGMMAFSGRRGRAGSGGFFLSFCFPARLRGSLPRGLHGHAGPSGCGGVHARGHLHHHDSGGRQGQHQPEPAERLAPGIGAGVPGAVHAFLTNIRERYSSGLAAMTSISSVINSSGMPSLSP